MLYMTPGHVEQQAYSDLTFRTQQRSFNVKGYAADPSMLREGGGSGAVVGDVHKAFQQGNDISGEIRASRAATRAQKRKRMAKGELGVFDSEDEDEPEEMEEVVAEDGTVTEVPKKKKEKIQKEYIGPWAGWEGEKIEVVAPTEEEYEEQEAAGGAPLNKKARKAVSKDAGVKEVGFGEEKSIFHGQSPSSCCLFPAQPADLHVTTGKELHDYLGRSYLHIPTDVDVNLRPSESGLQECFLPKKVIHTWSGHTKAISKIQLFPGSGHLILSGSMDTRVKVSPVREARRTRG